MVITTLNKIQKFYPYNDRWSLLLKKLGKDVADDEPLSFVTIIQCLNSYGLSYGLPFALWCCRTVPEHKQLWISYLVAYVIFCSPEEEVWYNNKKVCSLDPIIEIEYCFPEVDYHEEMELKFLELVS